MFSLVSTESMDAETELLQVCVCRLYTCCYSPCKFVWALLTKILIAFYWSCLRNSHSHILKEISGIHAKGSEVFLHGTWRDSLACWLFALLTNAPNLSLVTAGEVCWRQRWHAKLPKLIDLTWKCCSLLRQKKESHSYWFPHGLSGRKDTGYIVWEPPIGYCQEPKTVQAQTSKLHRCKLFTCQSSFVDGVQWVWFLSRQTFRMSEDAAIMKGICPVDEPRVQVSDFARERRHNGRISIQKPPWLLGASCHAVSVSDENRAVPWCFFSNNRTSMTMWDTSQG